MGERGRKAARVPAVQVIRIRQAAQAREGGEAVKVKLQNIELDASIQCRASINTETVNEYAERMTEGDEFPPVELFGTAAACWIGDGWHRVLAARQIGAVDIEATMHDGGRGEALKYALSANAANGLRRTNLDKRRCVEIALKEWPKLSDNAIAQLCGVDNHTVGAVRPATLGNSQPEKRTGADGKQYPATRSRPEPTETETPKQEEEQPAWGPVVEARKMGPPCAGMMLAKVAVMKLEEISRNDSERQQAFDYVKGWINDNEG
jgi:hypothetical protein